MIRNLPECRVLCFAEGGAALERLLPQLNIAAGQTALLVAFQQQGRLEGQLHAGEEIIRFAARCQSFLCFLKIFCKYIHLFPFLQSFLYPAVNINFTELPNASKWAWILVLKPPLVLPKAASYWLPLKYPDEQTCTLTIVASIISFFLIVAQKNFFRVSSRASNSGPCLIASERTNEHCRTLPSYAALYWATTFFCSAPYPDFIRSESDPDEPRGQMRELTDPEFTRAWHPGADVPQRGPTWTTGDYTSSKQVSK